jgi:dihydroorotase
MKTKIKNPLDMHIHFREGEMLKTVAPLSAKYFSGGVIMPNLVPPVDSLHRLLAYKEEIKAATSNEVFEPYMALFFKDYSEKELIDAKDHIIGIKLYPAGITTNSEAGVRSLEDAEKTMALLQELEIPLLVHGETEGFVMDREREFVPIYNTIAEKFPKLHIVMEHITTKEAVSCLDRYENIHATVTLQHLYITLDDVAGGMLNPHLFCKPIAKRPEDREALLEAALSAHPKLSFGSDSAPHPQSKKECCGCAAGVFTAPIALPMLAELFAKHDALDKLQAFVSDNAVQNYKVTAPQKTITLSDSPMTIPEKYGDVVPMYAGKEIAWSVTSID